MSEKSCSRRAERASERPPARGRASAPKKSQHTAELFFRFEILHKPFVLHLSLWPLTRSISKVHVFLSVVLCNPKETRQAFARAERPKQEDEGSACAPAQRRRGDFLFCVSFSSHTRVGGERRPPPREIRSDPLLPILSNAGGGGDDRNRPFPFLHQLGRAFARKQVERARNDKKKNDVCWRLLLFHYTDKSGERRRLDGDPRGPRPSGTPTPDFYVTAMTALFHCISSAARLRQSRSSAESASPPLRTLPASANVVNWPV